ncbi:hypothetical protein ACH49O_12975 [Streptomyces coeruleorubidus]|uniref:hypothetical protein n=1 Tax=Streptomyces coeruleorubidus TaxID=116188 RepID=UPI0033E4DB45
MDPALLAVASTSANALVSLMTTDLWERAKGRVAHIYTRLAKSPEALEQELEESRTELGTSTERGDLDETTTEMQQMWKGKFRRLLADHPEAAAELEDLVSLWQQISEDKAPGAGSKINQTATANDNSRIYQQGSGVQYNS